MQIGFNLEFVSLRSCRQATCDDAGLKHIRSFLLCYYNDEETQGFYTMDRFNGHFVLRNLRNPNKFARYLLTNLH